MTATFDEAMSAASVTGAGFELKNGSGATVPASVSYDSASRKATLTPTAPLAYGQSYTATVKAAAAGPTDTAGNHLASDRSWSFSTARACPCTVFDAGQGPLGNAITDSPIEVGMKVTAAEDGFITALRFYKQPNDAGAHSGSLWTAGGTRLAQVDFTNETASGWQTEGSSRVPIAVTAGSTYVTSYYAADGRFAMSQGFFFGTTGDAPLTAPPGTGNGVYRYGSTSGFPDQTFNATNYWVDATFQRTRPADTRAPARGARRRPRARMASRRAPR